MKFLKFRGRTRGRMIWVAIHPGAFTLRPRPGNSDGAHSLWWLWFEISVLKP
jgi:hypothetical protein